MASNRAETLDGVGALPARQEKEHVAPEGVGKVHRPGRARGRVLASFFFLSGRQEEKKRVVGKR